MFLDFKEYLRQVENRREACMRKVNEEFKNAELYLLDEEQCRRVRRTFDELPMCMCILTRLCESISVRAMFEHGMRSKLGSVVPGESTVEMPWPSEDVVSAFCERYEAHLDRFVRDVIRSVWTYGFVATTCRDGIPVAVDLEECLLFRNREGVLHVRSIMTEEALDLTVVHRPSVDGRLRSAVSYLVVCHDNVRALTEYTLAAVRNSAVNYIVTGPKDERKNADDDFEDDEDRVTGAAVENLVHARTVGVPRAASLLSDAHKAATVDKEQKLLADLVRCRREKENLRRSLAAQRHGGVHGLPDLTTEDVGDERSMLACAFHAKAHSGVEQATDALDVLVRNVLLGSVPADVAKTNSSTSSTAISTKTLRQVVESCSKSWQEFLTTVILSQWMKQTGIPLKPWVRRGIQDLETMMPMLSCMTLACGRRLLAEMLDVPEYFFCREGDFVQN